MKATYVIFYDDDKFYYRALDSAYAADLPEGVSSGQFLGNIGENSTELHGTKQDLQRSAARLNTAELSYATVCRNRASKEQKHSTGLTTTTLGHLVPYVHAMKVPAVPTMVPGNS